MSYLEANFYTRFIYYSASLYSSNITYELILPGATSSISSIVKVLPAAAFIRGRTTKYTISIIITITLGISSSRPASKGALTEQAREDNIVRTYSERLALIALEFVRLYNEDERIEYSTYITTSFYKGFVLLTALKTLRRTKTYLVVVRLLVRYKSTLSPLASLATSNLPSRNRAVRDTSITTLYALITRLSNNTNSNYDPNTEVSLNFRQDYCTALRLGRNLEGKKSFRIGTTVTNTITNRRSRE
ncbi:hypothetical protein KC326_g227, partial [Hortaea werneckii]